MKEEAGGICLCVVKLIRRRIVKEIKKKDGDLVSESIGPKPQPKQKAQ